MNNCGDTISFFIRNASNVMVPGGSFNITFWKTGCCPWDSCGHTDHLEIKSNDTTHTAVFANAYGGDFSIVYFPAGAVDLNGTSGWTNGCGEFC